MSATQLLKRLCSMDAVGQCMAASTTVLLALVVLVETLPRYGLLIAVWMSAMSLVLSGLVVVVFGYLLTLARQAPRRKASQ